MKYKDSIFMKLIKPIITLIFKILYNPKIIGKENIPKEGKIILAGNHTNNLDCLLVISSVKRNIHFLAKDELWKGPKKIIFDNLGLIKVNRRKKDKECLRHAIEYLKNEKVIGIFPEGTIGKKKLLPFKIGSVKMAYETNSEIIPFVITGKYKIFFNDLKIEFGKPIKIKSNDLEKENENLRNIIVKMMGDNNEYI